MSASLSILGLYNYDNTIFDSFHLPATLEKEDVLNNLLLELSELEILYPNPLVMKAAIDYWSKKELPVWEKLVATTTIEYDPISNLRRTETYDDKETRDLGGSTTKKTTNSGTDTNNRYVSAYNENSPTLAGKEENELGTQQDEQNTITDTGNVTNNRTVKMEGSIGVVLTQQMIEAERKVSEFNVINYIIESFKKRFCIMVY